MCKPYLFKQSYFSLSLKCIKSLSALGFNFIWTHWSFSSQVIINYPPFLLKNFLKLKMQSSQSIKKYDFTGNMLGTHTYTIMGTYCRLLFWTIERPSSQIWYYSATEIVEMIPVCGCKLESRVSTKPMLYC